MQCCVLPGELTMYDDIVIWQTETLQFGTIHTVDTFIYGLFWTRRRTIVWTSDAIIYWRFNARV